MIRLKELRLENGLTQKELGEIIGVVQTVAGKYERGALEPSLTGLKKLADYFKCSIDYLVGREDDFGNISVPMNAGEQLSPTEKKLLEEYRKLDYENKLYAETYISVRLEEQEKKKA